MKKKLTIFVVLGVVFLVLASLSCKNAVPNTYKSNKDTNKQQNEDIQPTDKGCYLIVNNQSEIALSLFNGNIRCMNLKGVRLVNRYERETFLIPFYKLPNGMYDDSMKMNTLGIGTFIHGVIATIPEYEFKLDTKYEITVHGQQANNLTLDPIIEKGKIK